MDTRLMTRIEAMAPARAVGSRLARLATALLLSGAAGIAFAAGADAAGGGADDTGPTGDPLVVSLDFVVPEYQAGAKFRSPATIDSALAGDLAKRLGRPLAVTGPLPGSDGATSDAGDQAASSADLRITTVADLGVVPATYAAIPLDYRAAPMAIMRTDSTIRRWEQLRDRKVCVAQGGDHVGDIAGRYGAVEVVHPSPTDALVALRVGDCDAMVHDSVMLEELIRFPEWKKFSRRLPPRPRSTLAVLVPQRDTEATSRVQAIVDEWKAERFAAGLVRNAVRNIAFEVYLEQDVPDCH